MKPVLLVILIPALALCAPLEESAFLKNRERRDPTAAIINEADTVANPISKSIDNPEASREVYPGGSPSSSLKTANKSDLNSRAGGLVGGLIGGLAQGLGGIVRGAEHAIEGVLETIQPGVGMQGGVEMQGGMDGGLKLGGGMGRGKYDRDIGGILGIPMEGTMSQYHHDRL